MTKEQEKEIRAIVQSELMGLINDAHEALGLKKDPTGMGRKALEGLANMVRRRQSALQNEGE